MREMIFSVKNKDAWYSDFDGKIIDLDKILLEETPTHYIVNLRGTTEHISTQDLNEVQQVEIDFSEEEYTNLIKMSKEFGMTPDELVNKVMRSYMEKEKESEKTE